VKSQAFKIRPGAKAFDVCGMARMRPLDESSADTVARQRTCEGRELGHEGHHVISHPLLATLLSRPVRHESHWVGRQGTCVACAPNVGRRRGRGRKIPEVLSELSYRRSGPFAGLAGPQARSLLAWP